MATSQNHNRHPPVFAWHHWRPVLFVGYALKQYELHGSCLPYTSANTSRTIHVSTVHYYSKYIMSHYLLLALRRLYIWCCVTADPGVVICEGRTPLTGVVIIGEGRTPPIGVIIGEGRVPPIGVITDGGRNPVTGVVIGEGRTPATIRCINYDPEQTSMKITWPNTSLIATVA